jgi:site-specific DNA recombinase
LNLAVECYHVDAFARFDSTLDPINHFSRFWHLGKRIRGIYDPSGKLIQSMHYRYYVSQTVLKHGAGSCPVGRVPAGEIETAVIDQLRAVFRQPEIVAGTWKAARAQDGEITEAEARKALQQLDPLWEELFPAEQARIAALLVERIDIGVDGLNVRLRVDGLTGLAREMMADLGTAA